MATNYDKWHIHSANPVRRDNIDSHLKILLKNFKNENI